MYRHELTLSLRISNSKTAVQRVSIKCCYDIIPDRCQEGCCLTILCQIVIRSFVFFKIDGPGLEAYQIKIISHHRRLRRNLLPKYILHDLNTLGLSFLFFEFRGGTIPFSTMVPLSEKNSSVDTLKLAILSNKLRQKLSRYIFTTRKAFT